MYPSNVNYVIDNFGPTDLNTLFYFDQANNAIDLEMLAGYRYEFWIRERIITIYGVDIETLINFDNFRTL